MKKLFLFFFASLLSISMFAAGETGKTKADAIPYAWGEGIKVVSDAGVGKWYKVDLFGKFDPATGKSAEGNADANILVANPLDEVAHVDVTAYIGDNETSRSFTLQPGEYKTMNIGAGMLVRMGIQYVYMYIVMDVTITPAQAEKIEVVVEDAPSNSVAFVPVPFNWGADWGSTLVAEGNTIEANKETWLAIDWYDNMADAANHTFVIYAQNLGSQATTIYGGLATDCPATSIQEQTKVVNAGGAPLTKELEPAMLQMVAGTIYVRLKADQPLKVWAAEVAPTTPPVVIFDASGATIVQKYDENDEEHTVYHLGGADIFKIDYATMTAPEYYYVQVEITNNGTEDVEITGNVAKNATGDVTSAVKRTYTVKAGQPIKKRLDNSLLSAMGTGDFAVAQIVGGNSNISFKLVEVCTETDTCDVKDEAAMVISASEVSRHQDANTTKWYKVDISAAKDANADIVLTMEAAEAANITVDIAADCKLGEPVQSYSGSAATTTKTLSNSLFKSAGNLLYVRVKTNKAVDVKAKMLTSIVWNGTEWVGGEEPTLEKAARIEGDLTIVNGQTIKALGITLAGGKITIQNGGKLIIGAEGVKGSQTVDQITIEKGGIILIDPAATSNNQPFVTVENTLKLGVQSATGHTLPEWHNFIALPIENREASFAAPLYYAHWDRMDGWIANDGFRHAFVGYNVFAVNGSYYQDPAVEQTVSYKGQLASNKNVTLSLPQDGWYAFGNSWTAPLPLSSIYSQLSGSGDDAAVHFYVDAPTDYAGIGTILDNYYIPATQEIASNLGISNIKPMQGFFLHTESSNSVTLDYNALYNNHKSAAPKRAEDNRNMVAAVLSNGVASDFVYMIEGEAGNASKMIGDKIAIYAENGLAQIANDNLIGTILTIKTTEETEYTLHFTWLKGETMYIKDLVNGNIIAMTAENQYTFTAEPNTVSERFQVIGRNDAPTGMENNAVIEGANKRIENGKVVIIKNGVKYDVLGTQL